MSFRRILSWESIGNTDGSLKPEAEVRRAVDSSPSQYVGNVGDRITINLKILSAIPNETKYGTSTFHVMEDNTSGILLPRLYFYTLGYDT